VVYIDDEPVGSTDPGSGRLVKAGMRPGLHRVRVARDGHADAVREIDLGSGATAVFHATLAPVSKEAPAQAPEQAPSQALPPGAGTLAFAVVAFALVGVLVWIALRRGPDASTPVATPTRAGAPSPATPSGQINPGARRDALGQEWFGEFRLLEMLGRGGMASVYKAERHGELSALKRPLLTLLDDPEFLERFLREADIGRTLNHPNIVRILERGSVERVPYFTMELLAGGTLQGLARSGAGEPRSAVAIVVQVAEALDFAHSKGVVHRDLKPSNVMLLLDGTVKVMDFGIAQARRFEGITATGAFLGTPDYVAPEMIEGRGAEARSDLYALGVILFELLTARQPFTAETGFALLKKHCTEDPPTPSQLRRGVPPELDAVVLRLLRKDPRDRPSAEELVVTLRDWLNRAA
jgi:serine/threonine protein kinase